MTEVGGMDLGTLLSAHWADLGATGLLGVVVLMVLTGRLVPRSQLKDVQADRDAWRQTALQAMAQNADLMVGTRVASAVLKELPDAARHVAQEPT